MADKYLAYLFTTMFYNYTTLQNYKIWIKNLFLVVLMQISSNLTGYCCICAISTLFFNAAISCECAIPFSVKVFALQTVCDYNKLKYYDKYQFAISSSIMKCFGTVGSGWQGKPRHITYVSVLALKKVDKYHFGL